jgi:hypothetical protein
MAAAALLLPVHFHLLLLLVSPSAAQPGEPPCPSIPHSPKIRFFFFFFLLLLFCLRRRRTALFLPALFYAFILIANNVMGTKCSSFSRRFAKYIASR